MMQVNGACREAGIEGSRKGRTWIEGCRGNLSSSKLQMKCIEVCFMHCSHPISTRTSTASSCRWCRLMPSVRVYHGVQFLTLRVWMYAYCGLSQQESMLVMCASLCIPYVQSHQQGYPSLTHSYSNACIMPSLCFLTWLPLSIPTSQLAIDLPLSRS